jgi:thiamine-monophosphate kinase
MSSMQHTTISTIGESGLIEKIRAILDFRVDDATLNDALIVGVGDDAAAFLPTAQKLQLLTTDALAEGVHFDLTFTSLKHLGWKAMAANLSDIAAMGGVPRYATISLSLPQKISVEMVGELYRGAAAACKKYSCRIIGGDTTASSGNMFLSVALTGEVEREKLLTRAGAKPGDLLCVSGHLGASAAGLKILQREKERFRNSDDPEHFKPLLEPYTPALEKHLMPRPRLDISAILTGHCTVHAAIDVSDGLATEVHHLCKASGTGAEVFEHNLPVEAVTQKIAGETGTTPTALALYSGEEYELLFALDDNEYARLESLTSDVTIIGRITGKEKGIQLVHEHGETAPLLAGGWEHFPFTAGTDEGGHE